MKRKNLSSTLAVAFLFLLLQPAFGQNLNLGFETWFTDGSPRNWGSVYIFLSTDSVVYDQQFYNQSSDAHSGSSALELRNAWNVSQNKGVEGRVSLDYDSVYTAYTRQEFNPITTVPTGFRFWYKYAPISGDTGLAELMILDQYLNRIGGARILLTAQTNYTEVFQPVEMESDSTPYFMTVYFSTFTSQNENKQPQLGTRLLLDDVEVTGLTSIAKPKSMKQTLVWPNPVSSTLFYNFEGTARIYNALGKLVLQSSETRLADVSPLPSGVYSIIFGNTTQGSVRFVKQ